MATPFVKMHGAGNDFVVIDSRSRGVGFSGLTTAGLARSLGDRNRGVGFDQLAEIRASGAIGLVCGRHFGMKDGLWCPLNYSS